MWLSCIGVLFLTSGGMCNLGGDHQHHGDHHQHHGDHNQHHGDHHQHHGDHHHHHGDDHNHHDEHQNHHNDPHKCTKRSLGCSSHKDEFIDDLGELFSLFGLKVLGKDQESADDRPPTEDHAHLLINKQAIIDELFSPSSTHRPATISPKLRTVTDSLPIKAHEIGRFSSPSDLVMSNHIAEPVFERKPRNFGSTTQSPVYLTETHYYLDHQNKHFSPLEHSRQGKQFDGNIQFSDHLDKPVMPVTDMRPFNFALINDVSVDEILNNEKRKTKVVSDLVDSDPFFNDVFKNIPTQELIERNKHIQATSFFSTNNQEESLISTNSNKVNDTVNEALASVITVNPQSHSSTHLKQQVRNKKRPSLHWEPPFRNPMERGNDHRNSVIQQTSQKSVPEQGRNTGITHNLQRQKISQNNKSSKTKNGRRQNINKQNNKWRRNPHSKSSSQNKSKLTHNISKLQKLRRPIVDQKIAFSKLPLPKISNRKNLNKDNQQSKALLQDTVGIHQKHASKEQPKGEIRKGQLRQHSFVGPNQQTKKQNNKASIQAPEGHRLNNRPPLQPRRGKQEMIIRTTCDRTINILHSTLGQLRKDVQNISKGKRKNTAPGTTRMNVEANKTKKTPQKEIKETGKLNSNKSLNIGQDSKLQRRPKAFTGDAKINHSTKLSSTFQCPENKIPGVYADISTSCQRFFMCHGDGRKGVFTCPLGTLFNQKHQVCDWPKQVDCSNSHIYFDI